MCTVIKKILDADGRPNPFVDNRPGRKWLKRFFERHTELTSRTTVQLGKERAIVSKGKITKWFDDFTSYINDELKEPAILSDPTRIYNADESGFSLCPSKGGKVIGEKGAPVVYHYGNSDKTQMTVMAAASAAGHFIQPLIIFPGQRFSYNPLEGFEEAALGRSENGWMDSEVFIGWLVNVFIPGIEERNVKKPVLLLIDGHKTHVSMEASDTCIAHGIELYCLLEHSSHLMQPLDLRFFGQLKMAWRHSVRDFQLANIGEFVTKQTFARVFKQAWVKATTIEAAIRGFVEAGLFPLNPSRVLESVKLQPSQVFEAECKQPEPAGIEASETSATPFVASSEPDISTPATPPVASSTSQPGISTPATPSVASSVSEPVISTSATPSVSAPTTSEVQQQANTQKDGVPSPFSKFLLLPKAKLSKPKVSRVLMPKAITGPKYRELLQEKLAKKAKEEEEKQKRKEARLLKRQEREEENKRKKLVMQKKKAEREAFKRKRKEAKDQKRAIEESILRDIEMSGSDDCMDVEKSKCYKCEEAYDAYIQCSNCYRRFHFKCVEDELTDCIDELPFECKYC